MPETQPQPSEKQFYLRSFRNRAIVFHVASAASGRHLETVLEELAANNTMLVVVARRFARGRPDVSVSGKLLRVDTRTLVDVSTALLADGAVRVRISGDHSPRSTLRFACDLAVGLGAHKLVVVDRRGGLMRGSVVRSFIKSARLAQLCRNGAGLGEWRKAELAVLLDAVRAGVESINLTRADRLAAELFTYEGAGSLLTAGEYTTVERLGVDDFPEACALIERGERDGFLKPRDAAARARLLLCGYGAWFEGGGLAGVAGLEMDSYRRRRLAEIVGLYTITRFQGEGVGVRLVRALAAVAKASGCRALFACTSNDRAAAFFARNGFEQVASERVPASKWRDRGRGRPLVFWKQLDGGQ